MKRIDTMIIIAAIALVVAICGARADDLVVGNNGGASNITATSAWFNVYLTSTGAANPEVILFWGTSNEGTNKTWAYTNSFGTNCAAGLYSTNITTLTQDTLYYYRAYASNASETAWADYPLPFKTLAVASNLPAAKHVAVMADTNGNVTSPTNFIEANGILTNGCTNLTGLVLQGDFDAYTTAVHNALGVVETNNTLTSNLVALVNGKADTNAANNTLTSNETAIVRGQADTNAANIAGTSNLVLEVQGQADTNLVLIGWNTTNKLDTIVNAYDATTSAWAEVNGSTVTVHHVDMTTPYQTWTHNLIVGDGGTATITHAMGSLVKFVATNDDITITFDQSTYSTSGVNRVALEVWADTNSIAFDSVTITNATAPTISTTDWTSLFFRKVADGLWKGRD